MTDDKGAGKLAEELFREWWLNNSELGLTRSGIGFHAFTSGFNASRKAERERCLKIVNDFCPCHDDIVQIEKRIREG
jgi:hypothetical protein